MKLQLFQECKSSNLGFWQCPPFLFIVMGLVTIFSMVGTYLVASYYSTQPEVAALIVVGVTILFLIVGNAIIAGFNKVAEANRMKSEFISVISHQLRSPLSIFKWTIDAMIMDDKKGKDGAGIESNLSSLYETTNRMTQIVNNLLEVGRFENGTISFKKEPIYINKLTDDTFKFFSSFATASNVDLKTDFDANIPAVIGDTDKIKMVLENLLDNAIRYTKKRGTILVSIKREGNKILWSIHDEGVGIPEKYKKMIFTKFFRVPNVMRYQTRGSGIGLYIVKAIIEELGGSVGFESVENQGTTFWFKLPIK